MIHYHGLPISGKVSDQVEFAKNRHVLISFWVPQPLAIVADVCSSFCLDNGAFSAWKRGVQPNWDDYVRWVSEWSRHPRYDFAFIPDVIGGNEQANKALVCRYAKKIKDGVPVYHLHESLDYAAKLCELFPRVAIGSSGEWPTPGAGKWWKRMAEVMGVMVDSDGFPKTRLHGLRMLSPKVFPRLPLTSADSCNAGMNAGSEKRFGAYLPPKAHHRATVIAARVESHNSCARWE
jgi:hypothetical protein